MLGRAGRPGKLGSFRCRREYPELYVSIALLAEGMPPDQRRFSLFLIGACLLFVALFFGWHILSQPKGQRKATAAFTIGYLIGGVAVMALFLLAAWFFLA